MTHLSDKVKVVRTGVKLLTSHSQSVSKQRAKNTYYWRGPFPHLNSLGSQAESDAIHTRHRSFLIIQKLDNAIEAHLQSNSRFCQIGN